VPEYGTGCFVACGRRQGLLALDLGSIFEKLLHQKTFNFVTAKKLIFLAINHDLCEIFKKIMTNGLFCGKIEVHIDFYGVWTK
jgi:hypothetical protein